MKFMLNFMLLDDLALARERRGSDVLVHLQQAVVERVGPVVELGVLDRMYPAGPAAIDLLAATTSSMVLKAVLRPEGDLVGRYGSDQHSRFGAIRTNRDPRAEAPLAWIQFCRKAQEAAEFAKLPKIIAQGLIGALRELEDNIHLHSQRAQDGIVAFRGTAEEFEFVVADSGIGVLAGLRGSPRYAHLADAGAALKTALSDGQSRLLDDDPGRGYGFHELFVSLANLNGDLRFRSDDHALMIDGSGPALPRARLGQKAMLQGFVVSVVVALKPAARGPVH